VTAIRLDARRGPLWINGSFAVFWTARTLSWAGTGISGVVLPVLVYDRAGSPTLTSAPRWPRWRAGCSATRW
jgi:hypothetical protein